MADDTTKPIEDVEVGDQVLATDPETGETGARRVRATITSQGRKDLVDVTVETGGSTVGSTTIVATATHQFWLSDSKRWTNARNLRVGDDLLAADGDTISVLAVRHQSEYSRVHNLTVSGIHAFHVGIGNDAALVHNDGSYVPPPPGKMLPGFPDAKYVGRGSAYAGGKRARWTLPSGEILEWDYQHGAVEKWSKGMKKHLGQFDPNTGEMQKPGKKGRSARGGC